MTSAQRRRPRTCACECGLWSSQRKPQRFGYDRRARRPAQAAPIGAAP